MRKVKAWAEIAESAENAEAAESAETVSDSAISADSADSAYSLRSATTGSIEDARRAGMQQATVATSSKTTGTAAKIAASIEPVTTFSDITNANSHPPSAPRPIGTR